RCKAPIQLLHAFTVDLLSRVRLFGVRFAEKEGSVLELDLWHLGGAVQPCLASASGSQRLDSRELAYSWCACSCGFGFLPRGMKPPRFTAKNRGYTLWGRRPRFRGKNYFLYWSWSTAAIRFTSGSGCWIWCKPPNSILM